MFKRPPRLSCRKSAQAFAFLLVAAAAPLLSCGGPTSPSGSSSTSSSATSGSSSSGPVETIAVQAAPTPAAIAEQPQPEAKNGALPPGPEEARQTVARVYGKAVTLDERHTPSFISGDFNGDGSEDIAVVVKPASGMVRELNGELSNWISEDPLAVVTPDPRKSVQPVTRAAPPVTVEQNDTLLVIIHGFKEAGWRNPQARQSYLLKNAVGGEMKTRPLKEMLGTITFKPLTRTGDVIEETIAGRRGFIYWTGAKYAWH